MGALMRFMMTTLIAFFYKMGSNQRFLKMRGPYKIWYQLEAFPRFVTMSDPFKNCDGFGALLRFETAWVHPCKIWNSMGSSLCLLLIVGKALLRFETSLGPRRDSWRHVLFVIIMVHKGLFQDFWQYEGPSSYLWQIEGLREVLRT